MCLTASFSHAPSVLVRLTEAREMEERNEGEKAGGDESCEATLTVQRYCFLKGGNWKDDSR